ncbi:MAG: S-layer homology domain-containing protein [Oscillospiraceae bacterium]|jgi:predicted peptidase|nr:S-layer homology domain-containing protein [Oscillospiraceae bacterium]
MKKVSKILTFALVLTLLAGLLAVGASAADTEKLVVLTAMNASWTEARGFIEGVEAYNTAIKILPTHDYHGRAANAEATTTVYTATLNAAGEITSLRIPDGIVYGYGVNPASGGKIKLGIDGKEYTLAAGSETWVGNKYGGLLVDTHDQGDATKYTRPIVDAATLTANAYASYGAILNAAGEITKLFIFSPSAAAIPLFDEVKKFQTAEGSVDAETGLKTAYAYYAPAEKADTKYPLVVWLHGGRSGATPWSSIADATNPIAKFASTAYQEQFTAGGAYVFAPQAPESIGLEPYGRFWSEETVASVYLALDEFIAANPGIDTDKIYIGGASMGGGMTWLLVQERPDFFAAAFPVSGYPQTETLTTPKTVIRTYVPDPDVAVEKLAYLPIWAIHGAGDFVAAPARTTAALNALLEVTKDNGTDTRLTLVSDNSHAIWASTALSNMLKGNAPIQDKDKKDVESTLIEWLNGQSASANIGRADGTVEPPKPAVTFTDVAEGQWFYQYITSLVADGIVNGFEDNTFRPDANADLGQLLKLVLLAAKYDAQTGTDTHWAGGYLAKALEDELLVGKTEADLDLPIDRLTVAQIAAKALKLETTLTESPFTDTDDASVLALAEAGIVTGDQGKYNPEGSITRAELSAIIYRIANLDTDAE